MRPYAGRARPVAPQLSAPDHARRELAVEGDAAVPLDPTGAAGRVAGLTRHTAASGIEPGSRACARASPRSAGTFHYEDDHGRPHPQPQAFIVGERKSHEIHRRIVERGITY